MAINLSVHAFYEGLTEIVGYKSGLVLDRSDILGLLREDEQLEEFANLNPQGGLRIRSEVYEDIIEYLLFRVGRLERRWNRMPGIDIFHKYKRDPQLSPIMEGVSAQFTAFLEKVTSNPKRKK